MQIPNNWTFDTKDAATCIDSHIPSELPWYPLALDLSCFLARCYLGVNGVILDLGCSTGAVTRSLSSTIIDRDLSCFSVDSSEAMVNEFSGVGEIKHGDMRDYESLPRFNVATLMLSLMFTKTEGRSEYLKRLEGKCIPGGAIIIVDKIISGGPYLNRNLARITTKLKLDSGVSEQNIIKKDMSLCGIQRATKDEIFSSNGYVKWFQVGEFAGYIKEVN